jgi:alpha/beta superfamily hydrolase
LEGTLLIPEKSKPAIVLLIAGSGPTDRNGNNPMMTNNSLKMLAESLSRNGVATLRYDKRGIGGSAVASMNEADLTFDTYIDDARNWIKWLRNSGRFGKVIVAGHSEGSLIGMVAAFQEKAEGYISLAGAGRPIDQVLMEQVKKNPNNTSKILNELDSLFDKLRSGETFEPVPPYLLALLRPSIQPYMISWFKYNPAEEIMKLKCPVLIIQGSTDIQVAIMDSEELYNARGDASYKVIEGMNHIFKNAPMDRASNVATYRNPDTPLSSELVPVILDFINKRIND